MSHLVGVGQTFRFAANYSSRKGGKADCVDASFTRIFDLIVKVSIPFQREKVFLQNLKPGPAFTRLLLTFLNVLIY
jgi:hypothetical protein